MRPPRPTTQWLAAAALLVLTLASCSKTGEPRILLGATIDRLDNDYFVKIKEGIEARARELGVDVTVHDAQGRDDRQIQQLETFINQGVGAVIIAAVNDDVPAIAELVKKARAKGIKVVAQSQRVATADAYVSIEQKPYGFVGGKMAGEWIRDHLGGKADVAVLEMPERPTIISRVAGIREGILSVAPGVQIVAQPQAPNAEKARSNVEATLQQFPTVQVAVSFNDDTALAAAGAIQARMGDKAKKDALQYAVFGLDAIPQALAAIADPASPFRGTVDIDPFGNGKRDVDIAIALVRGEDLHIAKMTESGALWVDVPMTPVTHVDAEPRR